ncbi:16S rRNA (adenine(1518)-N(6)/adenine(1519)-N(6))-dimethyltransferase RsmA [Amnimonas aquatica]|uniref:Ribosomal RNA small subunit methyltransferase A n=1 Tax=Amnimonas aquatica TaxID=2094561 RepID=A0A2P6AT03_9GAMM|nr:16S rRNA (adenine(1518)-N(6)/adenine(1519)-N(6))-dimethyltransferase RsmA [Amnimonas aquatica]PQA44786.1 16S rRNA (adenine(1518)-N(6)/adenine(1519)-N(6))-dimethyltransferase [Amnimonas aquatica]
MSQPRRPAAGRASSRVVDGHHARKRFGQNFLSDDRVIRQIVASFQPSPGQNVVEIGPGLGALTKELLPALGRLQVVELDRDLAARLPQTLAGLGELLIHEGDALQFDFSRLATPAAATQTAGNEGAAAGHGAGGLRVIGNLPYNISTPLIFHLLSHSGLIRDMHFMLQKEVIDRLCAEPGSGDYGRLTVMTQYRCQPEWLFDVPPEAFSPPPKVTSAIVRLTPHAELPWPCRDEKLLAEVVTTAFTMRRKTLRNALKRWPGEVIEAAGVDAGSRPETLSVADYVNITNALVEASP